MVVQSEMHTLAAFCWIQSVTYQLNWQLVLNQSFFLNWSAYKLQSFSSLGGAKWSVFVLFLPCQFVMKQRYCRTNLLYKKEGKKEIIKSILDYAYQEVSNSEDTTASITMWIYWQHSRIPGKCLFKRNNLVCGSYTSQSHNTHWGGHFVMGQNLINKL